jgi:hypothetical protein
VWGACPGSVQAQREVREVETDEQKTGTAAHWVAYDALRTGNGVAEYLGQVCPETGIVIDDEIVDGVSIYVEAAREFLSGRPDAEALVEQRLYMLRVHNDCFGTADLIIYCPERNELTVFDFKFGHRPVSAYMNLQLILYAIGAIAHFKIAKQCKLIFKIVSPRVYSNRGPIDTWETTSHVLWDVAETLRERARQAHENPHFMTGPWCRDCKAISVCPAARKSVYNLMDYCSHEYAIDEMIDSDLGAEYRLLEKAMKIVESRKDALADEIQHRIETKKLNNTSYRLEPGSSRWHWTMPDEQVVALVGALGYDAEVRKVKTVAQVRKDLPKAKRDEFDAIKSNVAEKKPGKLKLTHSENGIAHIVFGRK